MHKSKFNIQNSKSKFQKWGVALGSLVIALGFSGMAYAQGTVGISKPLVLLIALAALSLAPFVVIMATSFVKLAVVLSLVRNALGTQQVPPNLVITGLALVLTIYIMMPVAFDVQRAVGGVMDQGSNQPFLSQASVELLLKAANLGKEPMREFLKKNAHENDQALFYNLAMKLRTNPEDQAKLGKDDFISLIPAFVVSELKEAFQIGFVIFLPFLVIDIVVANILLSLGMFQISPITLSLPFKLLLFVLVDGWHLIVKGLILGYI